MTIKHTPVTPIGRFAPTPSGHLHLGSLYTAVACYLSAKSQDGLCYLRIDDIDTPRVLNGSVASILKTLKAYHFEFDGEVFYQSHHLEDYHQALQQLIDQGIVYACTCTRKKLTQNARYSELGMVYPNRCRKAQHDSTQSLPLRVIVPNQTMCFEDQIQGTTCQNLNDVSGDFVLRRSDGVYSYHLSTVIDDDLQGITEIIRGNDLRVQTLRHIYLRGQLGLNNPNYTHLPLITHDSGQKLSKQSHAPAVNIDQPKPVLIDIFKRLGLTPPDNLANNTMTDIWDWGFNHFSAQDITHLKPLKRNDQ